MLLLLFAVSLVAAIDPSDKAVGYHEKFGIPAAQRILAKETVENRIVGGIAAHSGENPYLAGLIITLTNDETSICAGTLLNTKKILTAGQCWYDGYLQGRRITVVLASLKLFSGGERQIVHTVVTHPYFNPRLLLHDLAMLTIPGVSLSAYINPATLPNMYHRMMAPPEYWYNGRTVKTSGYGIMSDNDRITWSQEQNSVYSRVISVEQCAQYYPQDKNIICTDGSNHWGACDGDAGAPLIFDGYGQNLLIGVSSFHSAAGCQSGYPFGHVRITSYMDWINRVLK